MISKSKTNHKKCGTINHNNKKFQIMYDKIAGNKFFYEITDNTLKIPAYEDYLYLDSMLNPTSMYFSKYKSERLTEDNNESPQNFKNDIKNLIIGAFLLSLTVPIYYNAFKINLLGHLNNPYLDVSEITIPIVEEYQKSPDKIVALENLKKAIENNPNLDDMEKEIFLSNLIVIEENFDYVNISKIEKRLSHISITYDPETNGSIIACYELLETPYFISNNNIRFFNCSSREDFISKNSVEYYKHVLMHEINHLFSKEENKIGSKLSEGITEILTCEYQRIDYTIYRNEQIATYMLIELLGVDTIKQYYFSNDPQVLITALNEIIDNEDKAYELLGEIDNLDITFKEELKNNNGTRDYPVYAKTFEQFNNLFNEYFYKKYGYNMTEDDIVKCYIIMQRSNPYIYGYPIDDLYKLMREDPKYNKQHNSHIQASEIKVTPIVYFSQELQNIKYHEKTPSLTIECDYTITDTNQTEENNYQNTISLNIEAIKRNNNKIK